MSCLSLELRRRSTFRPEQGHCLRELLVARSGITGSAGAAVAYAGSATEAAPAARWRSRACKARAQGSALQRSSLTNSALISAFA